MEIFIIVWTVISSPQFLAGALLVSEALAVIPGIKANSIYQAIVNTLKKEQPK